MHFSQCKIGYVLEKLSDESIKYSSMIFQCKRCEQGTYSLKIFSLNETNTIELS